MKRINTIYMFIILVLICSCVFFLSKNYIIVKNLMEVNKKLQLQESGLKEGLKKKADISYGDVLERLNEMEGIQVLNFTRDSQGKVTVHVEISGDKANIADTLKKIRQKENFYDMDNITVEQDQHKNIKAEADVNFVP